MQAPSRLQSQSSKRVSKIGIDGSDCDEEVSYLKGRVLDVSNTRCSDPRPSIWRRFDWMCLLCVPPQIEMWVAGLAWQTFAAVVKWWSNQIRYIDQPQATVLTGYITTVNTRPNSGHAWHIFCCLNVYFCSPIHHRDYAVVLMDVRIWGVLKHFLPMNSIGPCQKSLLAYPLLEHPDIPNCHLIKQQLRSSDIESWILFDTVK